MSDNAVFSGIVILLLGVSGLLIELVFGVKKRILSFWLPEITPQDITNKLRQITDEGVDGISWSRLDLDDFVQVWTPDGWRMGIKLRGGDLLGVANARSKNHKEIKTMMDEQPLVLFRRQWPDDVQKLQDVIAAALRRDGSLV